jgi:hypothetical protein
VEEEEEDDDIFAGVEDYDLNAGLEDDDSSSDEEADAPKKRAKPDQGSEQRSDESTKAEDEKVPDTAIPMPPPPRPKKKLFDDEPTINDAGDDTYKPPTSASDLLSTNPEIAAALAKAAKLNPLTSSEEAEREKRRKAITEAHDRDSYDIDFGFGGSRDFGDEDDDDYGGASGTKSSGPKKRKRGGKKKGDKNDAGVVGKIVEDRYGKA